MSQTVASLDGEIGWSSVYRKCDRYYCLVFAAEITHGGHWEQSQGQGVRSSSHRLSHFVLWTKIISGIPQSSVVSHFESVFDFCIYIYNIVSGTVDFKYSLAIRTCFKCRTWVWYSIYRMVTLWLGVNVLPIVQLSEIHPIYSLLYNL